jgi:DNA-binding transcriptional ArsR family regulator
MSRGGIFLDGEILREYSLMYIKLMKNLWLFDEKRIAILEKLLQCDAARGCDIRNLLKMKKALMSHHLSLLREKGLVLEEKIGREKYYRIPREKKSFVKKVITLVE